MIVFLFILSISIVDINCQYAWESFQYEPAKTYYGSCSFFIEEHNVSLIMNGWTVPNQYTTEIWQLNHTAITYGASNENIWKLLSVQFPGTPRAESFCFTFGEKLHIGGGRISTSTFANDLWSFDYDTMQFDHHGELTIEPRAGSNSFIVGGNAYVVFGHSQNAYLKDVHMLVDTDNGTSAWIEKSNFPGPERAYAVSFVVNDIAYVGTGTHSSDTMNDFWKYYWQTDSWIQVQSLPSSDRDRSTSFVLNNYGFITLGIGGGNFETETWKYDTENDMWTQIDDYPSTAKSGAVSIVAYDTVFIVGGTDFLSTPTDIWTLTYVPPPMTQFPVAVPVTVPVVSPPTPTPPQPVSPPPPSPSPPLSSPQSGESPSPNSDQNITMPSAISSLPQSISLTIVLTVMFTCLVMAFIVSWKYRRSQIQGIPFFDKEIMALRFRNLFNFRKKSNDTKSLIISVDDEKEKQTIEEEYDNDEIEDESEDEEDDGTEDNEESDVESGQSVEEEEEEEDEF
jgi:hypothetical protein